MSSWIGNITAWTGLPLESTLYLAADLDLPIWQVTGAQTLGSSMAEERERLIVI